MLMQIAIAVTSYAGAAKVLFMAGTHLMKKQDVDGCENK